MPPPWPRSDCPTGTKERGRRNPALSFFRAEQPLRKHKTRIQIPEIRSKPLPQRDFRLACRAHRACMSGRMARAIHTHERFLFRRGQRSRQMWEARTAASRRCDDVCVPRQIGARGHPFRLPNPTFVLDRQRPNRAIFGRSSLGYCKPWATQFLAMLSVTNPTLIDWAIRKTIGTTRQPPLRYLFQGRGVPIGDEPLGRFTLCRHARRLLAAQWPFQPRQIVCQRSSHTVPY